MTMDHVSAPHAPSLRPSPPANSPRPAALVTGGALRIGRAIAERLAADGFDIALHCHRSETDAIALCNDLRTRHPGIDCGIFPADLASPDETAALLPAVARSFPRLSLLVHNAAVYRRAPLVETDDALLDETWHVNVRAPLVLSRDFARVLADNRAVPVGRIVHLLDCRIAAPRPSEFAYELSKRALAAATDLLARELAPRILVNAIAPGSTLPPPSSAHHASSDPAGHAPLGRHPAPADIADAVAYLARATLMTGQILYLDGGLRLALP